MSLRGLPAVYMRGGTSRALFFHRRDLPAAQAEWDPIFLGALGSPDPNGRQLDGMGGGISSLSKIAVIGPPTRDDADVDYTFAQVQVDAPVVGYRGNCGNISSAVGPFAVEEGLVAASGDEATVRIHNTNTGKIIVARFPLENGRLAPRGDFALQGIAGTAAPIRLAFLNPGGAATGQLLPTGRALDKLDVPGLGVIEASMVDAANPVVFVTAAALSLSGTESPAALSTPERLARFEDIRAAAALAMGLVRDLDEARTRLRNLPQVALLAPPQDAPAADGSILPAASMDVLARMISAGQPHKATPLTGAMCLAVAARVPGSLVQRLARPRGAEEDIRVAHPSGILPVTARTRLEGGTLLAEEAVVYRTARRLMEGRVLFPD
ncbi:2-methylaconitate cis-trans isomerase PrpF family protein [Pseudoroseomonas ludipueritiae]|uniref:PrpF family protein n=1 Tax=Pseudoroseomonas ludipueritiae TaxID=198093 RepID=A0ABR7R8K8_9PROT|nr:PrpF domain-containing protein [Pseudoroseomonas ludipueritiae]MBC9178136.1 PrpF family protein [Pseudoroseomonas ludipueritiae]